MSTCNISSKSMHTFLSNLANRQTDRETNTGKTCTSSFIWGNNDDDATVEALCFCLVHRTTCPGVCSLPSVFLSLHNNTEWILMKFAGGKQWNQQIKLLHFGRNRNMNKGAGYNSKFESMSTNVVTSNRCWRLANEFTNFRVHTKAGAIVDIIAR